MNRDNRSAMIPVRILDEEEFKKVESSFASDWQKYSFMLKKDAERISKKFKPTVLFLSGVFAWTVVTCGITGTIVKRKLFLLSFAKASKVIWIR